MRIKIYKKKKALYILIECFNINCMQANPDKFQAIAVGKKTYAKETVFNIESANISCDEVVKLLGIDIDYQLSAYWLFLSKPNKLTIFHSYIKE